MVRRIIILFFGVLSLASSVRGQNTFNQRILVGEGAFQPASLFVNDNQILVYSLLIDQTGYHLCSSIYSFSGIELDTLCINSDWGTYGVFAENDGQSYSGKHIQAGVQNMTDNLFGAFYQIYSENGEPERFHTYMNPWWSGDSLDQITQQSLPRDWLMTEDGDVLLSYRGESNQEEGTDCGVILFNEEDEYQWHLEWINEESEQIFAMAKLGPSFYLALNSFTDEFVVNGEIQIYKVSGSGQILDAWEEPWVFNSTEVLEMVADGDDLVCIGSYVESPEFTSDALIFKLDTMMNVHWWSIIDNQNMDYRRKFEDITITTDGNYVVSGQYPYELEETDPLNGDFMDDGWLAKFGSETGDLLWQRFFRIVESTNKIHEIFDLKSTPDGGVAFCGESVDLTDDFGPGNPVQQGWLVKVDKYGCLVPGCQINDIDEISGKEKAFSFGPNPLPKGQSLNLFNSRDFSSNAQYEILSTDGRLIASISAGYADLTTFWSLPELSSGVYVLQLKEEGRIVQAEKLVVE